MPKSFASAHLIDMCGLLGLNLDELCEYVVKPNPGKIAVQRKIEGAVISVSKQHKHKLRNERTLLNKVVHDPELSHLKNIGGPTTSVAQILLSATSEL